MAILLAINWPLAIDAAPATDVDGAVEPPVPGAADHKVVRPGIYAELTVIDAPFAVAHGLSAPSMEQSLWLTAGLYQGMHLGLAALLDPMSPSWQRRALGVLAIATADVLTIQLPGFLAWQHEEWHRAVMSSRGIDSFNDIYRLQLFSDIVNVSHVTDDDLVRLKAQHPADQVRLGMAGIEGNYASAHALEKAAFFHDARSWNTALYWLLYLGNSLYMSACANDQSDVITAEANAREGANVPRRDFTGLDCDGWAYDLFRPDEPYTARGIHPSGVGIDRYRSYSHLAPDEQAYVRRQTKLSLLNFLDPNLLGIHRIRWPWSSPDAPVDFNVAVRYLPAAFGGDIRTDVFVRQGERLRGLVSLHAGLGGAGLFPGLDVEFLRIPVGAIGGAPVVLDARGSLWLQPERLRYRSGRHVAGGLASIRAAWGGPRRFEPFVAIEAKTEGWVAGNVYLGRNVSARAGLILRLP